MTQLQNKILSFSPEVFRPYTDEATPSTGSPNIGSETADTITLSAASQITSVIDGPIGGFQRCWRFDEISGITTARVNHSNTTSRARLADRDFTLGYWIKFETLPNNSSTTANGLFSIDLISATGPGFRLAIAGTAATPNASKLSLQHSNGTALTTVLGTTIIQTGIWYYIAIRRVGTEQKIYINGNLEISATLPVTTATGAFNYPGGAGFPQGNSAYRISHFHFGTSATFTEQAIQEIWTAGSSVGGTNVTFTTTPATASALAVTPTVSVTSNAILLETPATASALQTEPTIIITTPNYTQITTSILVSATFPSNITVVSNVNVNNVVTQVLTASVELINNVVISTGTNESFSAAEFTATATFPNPLLPPKPGTANASFVNPTVYVNPSYRRLVKPLNPSLYVHTAKYANNVEVPLEGNINDGNDNWGNASFDTGIRVFSSPTPLNLSGDGNSFGSAIVSELNRQWGFTSDTAKNTSEYFNTPGPNDSNDFTIEFWYYPKDTNYGNIITLGVTTVAVLANSIRLRMAGDEIEFDGYPSLYDHTAETSITLNNWHHIVITVNFENTVPNTTSQIWHNGSLIGTKTARFVNPVVQNVQGFADEKAGLIVNSGANNLSLTDEIALYKSVLSNSAIVEHYTFMLTNSPNVLYSEESLTASAQSGTHNFLVTSNVNYPPTPATVTAIFANPTVLAQRQISRSATPLTASANNTDAEVYWGWTIVATPAIAAIESVTGTFLKNTYYNYVQTNIAPYRYVSFDAANALLDYGIDNDYAVSPTVVGGTIVNPDLGINGKSAKTAGTSYITDGVILKESEWDDDWGTTTNTYHSAFWFQRAEDDTSTTGLRVIWNLNGHYDNQHIILYQYQNKLTLSFSDGTINFINQSTVNNINLFDGQRHFIVVYIDHQGVNDSAYLYVDGVLQMTVDLDTYRVETINGITLVGPNDEANNHPRLSVGCLITPFGATSLPVVPTNTKLIIDEIYWDKDAITPTMVTNLFNVMPDKDNSNTIAETMTATVQLVMPAFSTSSVLAGGPFAASVELIEPLTTADREVIRQAQPMTATSLFAEARLFEDRTIVSDLMIATAIFSSAGIVISVQAPTMTATITLPKNIATHNGLISGNFVPLIRYVRYDALINSIPSFVEVK